VSTEGDPFSAKNQTI